MYLLPFYIERIKLNGDAECFVQRIRLNTIFDHPDDGLIRDYNPNELPYRIEKKRGIYLKDARRASSKKNGATTALFVQDRENESILTVIQYNGIPRSIVFVIILITVVTKWIMGAKNIDLGSAIFMILLSVVLFGWDNFKPLKIQRDLVLRVVKSCKE